MKIEVDGPKLASEIAALASISDAEAPVVTRIVGGAWKERQVSVHTESLNADAPADCAPAVIEALSESCRKHNLTFLPMVSRAYHDSLFMSRIAPTAMLFVTCRNGYSHRPDEDASPEDIARGTLVPAETLAALSR
jgi:ureidoglycolate amidohydrolase